MTKVPSRCPEQFAIIFVFRFKNLCINISISEGRTGEREVSTVQTLYPEQCAIIFIFRFKKVFINISI